MTLDELYGEGSSVKFHENLRVSFLPDPIVDESPLSDSVLVSVHWGQGPEMTMECSRRNIEFRWLTTGSDEAMGLYSYLCEHWPDFLKSLGVVTVTARPAAGEPEDRILSRGKWEKDPIRAGYVWRL